MNHFNIDKSPAIHREIIGMTLALGARRAYAQGRSR